MIIRFLLAPDEAALQSPCCGKCRGTVRRRNCGFGWGYGVHDGRGTRGNAHCSAAVLLRERDPGVECRKQFARQWLQGVRIVSWCSAIGSCPPCALGSTAVLPSRLFVATPVAPGRQPVCLDATWSRQCRPVVTEFLCYKPNVGYSPGRLRLQRPFRPGFWQGPCRRQWRPTHHLMVI